MMVAVVVVNVAVAVVRLAVGRVRWVPMFLE
jgi:hypothetical protein